MVDEDPGGGWTFPPRLLGKNLMQQDSPGPTPRDGPLQVSTSGAPGARGFPQPAASKRLAPSATTTVALLPPSRPPPPCLFTVCTFCLFWQASTLKKKRDKVVENETERKRRMLKEQRRWENG